MKALEADSSAGMPLEEKVRDAHLEGRWISMKKASQKISFLCQWMSERLLALADQNIFNVMGTLEISIQRDLLILWFDMLQMMLHGLGVWVDCSAEDQIQILEEGRQALSH